ncbi:MULTISPECIES: hypothetical protein [Aneurinibacillus]|uniref:Uncharacterized protein n=1 Tax=Aneurinibacillus danicus TaxID=267746 RepID=A0A511VCB0_9BACL|nr:MULTISPECIES: hypothetical protein [Aneurinibacillus]GEN34872.1 hypothetical protein ADA01nite_23320 [Aneurinibacillus danicus]
MITCETCGKTSQGQEIGKHWICGDCRVDEAVETQEVQAEQIDNRGNVH